MKGLIAVAVELLFGLGVWRVLYLTARPTWKRPLRTPTILDGPITTDSDWRGLI